MSHLHLDFENNKNIICGFIWWYSFVLLFNQATQAQIKILAKQASKDQGCILTALGVAI